MAGPVENTRNTPNVTKVKYDNSIQFYWNKKSKCITVKYLPIDDDTEDGDTWP